MRLQISVPKAHIILARGFNPGSKIRKLTNSERVVHKNKVKKMPQSLSNVIIHLIFSTKGRERTIQAENKNRLHAYIATVIRDMRGNAFRVGGTEDHVHIACSLPPTITQSDFIKKIKGSSSQGAKRMAFIIYIGRMDTVFSQSACLICKHY